MCCVCVCAQLFFIFKWWARLIHFQLVAYKEHLNEFEYALSFIIEMPFFFYCRCSSVLRFESESERVRLPFHQNEFPSNTISYSFIVTRISFVCFKFESILMNWISIGIRTARRWSSGKNCVTNKKSMAKTMTVCDRMNGRKTTHRYGIKWRKKMNKELAFIFKHVRFDHSCSAFHICFSAIRLPIAIIRERYCHLKWDKKPNNVWCVCARALDCARTKAVDLMANSVCVRVMLGYLDCDFEYNETVKAHKLTSKELN